MMLHLKHRHQGTNMFQQRLYLVCYLTQKVSSVQPIQVRLITLLITRKSSNKDISEMRCLIDSELIMSTRQTRLTKSINSPLMLIWRKQMWPCNSHSTCTKRFWKQLLTTLSSNSLWPRSRTQSWLTGKTRNKTIRVKVSFRWSLLQSQWFLQPC